MSSNIQRSENHNDICKFENCNRIANHRRLKVGNCHIKNTKYEFCVYHRPKNSINKRFLYKTIFDQHEIKLKYYNHSNEQSDDVIESYSLYYFFSVFPSFVYYYI